MPDTMTPVYLPDGPTAGCAQPRDRPVRNNGTESGANADFACCQVAATWTIPGGSPDMGGISASGRVLWLSARYDSAVYAISTHTGKLIRRIPWAPGRMDCASGRSPVATRSGTRESCASRKSFVAPGVATTHRRGSSDDHRHAQARAPPPPSLLKGFQERIADAHHITCLLASRRKAAGTTISPAPTS
jgi:hypothetical protein